MPYSLKYSFECGSAVCLWSNNKKAEEKFGLAVDLTQLPISENTKRWLYHLISWYDTSVNWDNPPETGEFWDQDKTNFIAAANIGYEKLIEELTNTVFSVENKVAL